MSWLMGLIDQPQTHARHPKAPMMATVALAQAHDQGNGPQCWQRAVAAACEEARMDAARVRAAAQVAEVLRTMLRPTMLCCGDIVSSRADTPGAMRPTSTRLRCTWAKQGSKHMNTRAVCLWGLLHTSGS